MTIIYLNHSHLFTTSLPFILEFLPPSFVLCETDYYYLAQAVLKWATPRLSLWSSGIPNVQYYTQL